MILCAMGTLAISFQRVFLEKGEREGVNKL